MSRRINAVALTSGPARARPLLKWPGGKDWLAPRIMELVHQGGCALTHDCPASQARYFEPFVGGAALFWALRPTRAMLSDANAELVNVYRVVRDDVESLIIRLGDHVVQHALMGADWYYRVRHQSPSALEPVCRAARTIFLNKSGFNGLYRVNSDGGFNVPHGRTSSGKPPTICDADNLRRCSAALQGVRIGYADFRDAAHVSYGDFGYDSDAPRPEAGDLVYLDPPYVPEPGKQSFTAYTADGFDDRQQVDVAKAFRALADRGVYVLASNSRTERVRELYRGFKMIEVARPGGNNSDPTKRQRVPELLIVGWERT